MRITSPSVSLRCNRERPSTILGTKILEFINKRNRTIKFYTLGCKVNQYDTQAIREQFLRAGFKEICNEKKADIYIINTCTVTAHADRDSRHLIYQAHRRNPKAKIVVTGCYTELDSDVIAKIPGITHIIKNQNKARIFELLNGHKKFNEPDGNKEISISNFSGHTRAFLKIQDGCDNSCSYCKVPLVRGRSRSKPINEILEEASNLVKNGFKEIVLCGICLGLYGKDLDPRVSLIDVIEVLENIEDLLRIRLSSIEAGDVTDELIEKISKTKKLCQHLHIPMQSGDDEILKKMNRKYRRDDYLKLIKKIKSRISEIAITTDILVGFPCENESGFQNTLDLVKEMVPLKVHIFPYSDRERTLAANFRDKVSPNIIKERVNRLKNLADACAQDYKKQLLDKAMDVLIEERLKNNTDFWEGYTGNYIKVLLKSNLSLKNKIVSLRLKNTIGNCILAEFY